MSVLDSGEEEDPHVLPVRFPEGLRQSILPDSLWAL